VNSFHAFAVVLEHCLQSQASMENSERRPSSSEHSFLAGLQYHHPGYYGFTGKKMTAFAHDGDQRIPQIHKIGKARYFDKRQIR
jgi:hypothetical protein